eukprot:2246682-Rhodomonas_salina.3
MLSTAVLAETMITGRVVRLYVSRSLWQHSIPFMCGIIMSRRTRSGVRVHVRMCSSASIPV